MAQKIVTLITGGEKGLGLKTAQALSKQGQVIVIGALDTQKAKAAVEAMTKAGNEASYVALDVTNHAQVQAAEQYLEDKYGYLTILINNAGIVTDAMKPSQEIPLAALHQEFDVNFFGSVDVTQTMVPLLKKAEHAQIINLSSNMGSLGLATDPNFPFYNMTSLGYAASKAAINFETVSFSKDLKEFGIAVNSVNPGFTDTEFGGRNTNDPKPAGMQTPDEGAAQIIKMASQNPHPANATFTENAGELPW
ncbi:SDR family NAD(P)-dependent oxidoreductase [Lactobacillus sp. CRM56-3]|uniref:SDR family NAD(P)-dependent oxidoreductase n=2 Tax=Secundilactobacillus folii TaxID=2678357 RepID=A0A7X2XV48_9LACO|nr:SDR family NAD(P)-dependent oxidoreductase [Secundilactobacillus folii]MTV82253.1 SDR family NAD(P)-dependent oxidoreductase [Secundilactobacillus folii]